ncbi:MAG TPA: AraC family transcriptional regulator, partial [Polyangiaceae bacterium]|nr:AraC family transcriptional regulator [Polyangiaceae bacterium]
LDTLTLEPENLSRYQRWLECFARLVAGQGDAQALAAEATAIWQQLEGARIVQRIWDASRNMVSESTTRSWLAPHIAEVLPTFGLNAVPEHALVGLMRADPDASDAVDAVLRRDAYQRACVDLALARKGVIGGRVGDHGVMFLVAPGASPARLRAALHDLAEQAALLARRKFGLSVHFGVSAFRGSKTLPARYDQALAAAEQALAEGRRLVDATPERRAGSSILHIRRQLARASEERPSDLPARFERYLEAVAADSGYRLELCRVHLEAGFDEATRALRSSGAIPDKSYQEMCTELDRAARGAATTRELFAAYRRGVQDVVELAERPVQAGQDVSLRRGIAYAHEHFAEPLSSRKVARVAGLSHPYFCQLFKRREKMTFEKYVGGLRIERAKQLLVGTKLSAERVGQLSGFRLRPYFHRVFRQVVGMTPAQYREHGR